jgi:hypothetical protein
MSSRGRQELPGSPDVSLVQPRPEGPRLGDGREKIDDDGDPLVPQSTQPSFDTLRQQRQILPVG